MTFFLSISLSAILLILIRLLLLATIWSDSRRAGLRFHVVVQSKFSALSFLAINFGFETSEGFVFGSSFFQVPVWAVFCASAGVLNHGDLLSSWLTLAVCFSGRRSWTA
ncbi:hypothetical protein V6N11_054592 [Hibiscus sabdariffa]|uniref:Secreted peptide n=1 Tax=Hibiscus sabdariffa TaxID=183260 RepID=A0ABR2S4K1_9ROSI